MREAELLSRIRAIFDRHQMKPDLLVDNGDDGAIIDPKGKEIIVAADVAVEGIHFNRHWSSPRDIGRKITAANLADICAMGGWPEYLIVTAVIPQSWINDVEEIARGIAHEADLVGAAIIGGDLATGNELSISITAIGYCERKLLRSGAKIGDSVLISHVPGWSAAGLSLLQRGINPTTAEEKRAIEQHRHPAIDYARYRSTYPFLNSATDISDGLLVDASHIASASGVSLELKSSQLVDEELALLGDPRPWMLGGGEDHVLLVTSATPEKCLGFIEIGEVVSGNGEVRLDGETIESAGFQHEWRS